MSIFRLSPWCVLLGICVLSMPSIAQTTPGEPFDGVVRSMDTAGGNVFDCPESGNWGSPPCEGDIFYRYYSDHPRSLGRVNPIVDGNPIYVIAGTGSYRADVGNSANHFGAPHPEGLPMYLLWDAQRDGDIGDHRGYYVAQSQVINASETGNVFGNCAGTRLVSCFAVAYSRDAHDVPESPQGVITHLGSLSPIPVPVVNEETDTGVILEWVEPTQWKQTPAQGGDTGDAPNPITGVNLYVLESDGVLDPRGVTVAELDSGARFLRHVPLGSTTTEIVFNDDIDPAAATFIPVIRLAYRAVGNGPALESIYWSANGPAVQVEFVCITPVVDLVVDNLGKEEGRNVIEISWSTEEERCLEGFRLFRSFEPGGPEIPVGDPVPPRGEPGGGFYVVEDRFVAGPEDEAFYRLVVLDTDEEPRSIGPIRVELVRKVGNQGQGCSDLAPPAD